MSRDRYAEIKKLTAEQRKEIFDFAMARSREMSAGIESDDPRSICYKEKPVTQLEKIIEDEFCEYAREQGCEPIKFKDPSRRDAPDRMVLCPTARTIFFEFKRPGEKPRPGQLQYHEGLRALGFECHVVDNYYDAFKIFNYFLYSLDEI
jgi:hypothetical protein